MSGSVTTRSPTNTAKAITGRRISSRTTIPVSSLAPALNAIKRTDTNMSTVHTLCDLESLYSSTSFATNHENFVGFDGLLGHIICQIWVSESKVQAHVISSAGSLCMLDQVLLPIDEPKSSQIRNPLFSQSLATALRVYLQRIPPLRRVILEAKSRMSTIQTSEHVTQLMDTMRVCRDLSLDQALLQFIKPKFSQIIDVDLILESASPLHQILPKATDMRLRDISLDKVPILPEYENTEKRDNLIHEILSTERTYVNRLNHLVKDYAIPVRAASRKQKGIIGPYETNALFPSSIDAILLLNQDFLKSLEASSGDFEFALTLVNGFKDFQKIYARYLETSTDLDQILRSVMKAPRFKEFTDTVRSNANANIGIRELVMEPISRIPRYSLLISALLQTIVPSNPSYQIFQEALSTVRRIGLMERDRIESSQEILMKLAALVSSWPPDLVKSSLTVLDSVDCLDAVPPLTVDEDSSPSSCPGNLCSVILCSDRLIFLKRSRNYRFEEVLSLGKKGELGYRGYAMLSDLLMANGDDCLDLLLMKELIGVHSERWIGRPYRKLRLMASDARKFLKQVHDARASLKQCAPIRYSDPLHESHIRFHVYDHERWAAEQDQYKSDIRIWENNNDGEVQCCNLMIRSDETGTFSCTTQIGVQEDMICLGVGSISILKEVVLEKIEALHAKSWFKLPVIDDGLLVCTYGQFLTALCSAIGSTPLSRSRPSSPSKIMSSFLNRKERDGTPARPSTAAALVYPSSDLSSRSFAGHTITKKKSGTLFRFGNDNKYTEGVDAFTKALVSFDHFTSSDLAATNQVETKEAGKLMSLISKDAKKQFAILGSPAKIALHAFKMFCRMTLTKKLGGSLLSEVVTSNLRSHVKHEPESRISRMRAVLKTLPKINLSLLRSLLYFGHYLIRHTPESSKIQALLLVSEMLVTPLAVTSFLSTLEILIDNLQDFFPTCELDLEMTSSVTSNMSLRPLDSKFGSLSSASHSHYNTEIGTYTSLSRSPARHSTYSATPDLIHDSSSPEAGMSLARSQSGQSLDQNSFSDFGDKYKRATIHVEQPYGQYNMLGLTDASQGSRDLSLKDKDLPATPKTEYTTDGEYLVLNTPTNGKQDQDLDKALEPTPYSNSYLASDVGRSSNSATSFESLNKDTTTTVQPRTSALRRDITPSRIPIASPKITKDHSRQTSDSFPSISLNSKKDSGIPRLPSTLIKRRESKPFGKSISDHDFQFDSDLVADYNTLIQYTSTKPVEDRSDVQDGEVLPITEARSPEPQSASSTSTKEARAALRQEITGEARVSSAATIRRISRQLENTSVGALDRANSSAIRGSNDRSVSANINFLPTSEHVVRSIQSRSGCTTACKEELELMRLELEHYKTIYRACVEEVDVTLDLANEQIEQLQIALDSNSLEAAAISMLELEKESNRKLRLENAALRERP